jgi:hypothetical protein
LDQERDEGHFPSAAPHASSRELIACRRKVAGDKARLSGVQRQRRVVCVDAVPEHLLFVSRQPLPAGAFEHVNHTLMLVRGIGGQTAGVDVSIEEGFALISNAIPVHRQAQPQIEVLSSS